MIISEFSSLVFDRENYKYDQDIEYKQVFGKQDFIRICLTLDKKGGERPVDVDCILTSPDSTTLTFDRQEFGDTFIVFSLSTYGLEYGTYNVKIINNVTLRGYESEFDIVSDYCLENTLVLKYSDTRNKFETIFLDDFGTNIFYSFRFVGSILERDTDYGIEGAVFKDQNMRSRTLSGFVNNTYKLIVGDNFGVPNGFGRHVRNALSCNKCYLNGLPVSITEASSLDREAIADTFPFFRFSMSINYNKNVLESNKLKNYRYLCNNNKQKLLFNNDSKFIKTNRKF